MKRRKYTTEFKKDAVRMVIIEGQKTSEVSAQLGINTNQLHRWKREHLENLEATSSPAQSSPAEMAEEIHRLRKELAHSVQINEILKKTVGYFAKNES